MYGANDVRFVVCLLGLFRMLVSTTCFSCFVILMWFNCDEFWVFEEFVWSEFCSLNCESRVFVIQLVFNRMKQNCVLLVFGVICQFIELYAYISWVKDQRCAFVILYFSWGFGAACSFSCVTFGRIEVLFLALLVEFKSWVSSM